MNIRCVWEHNGNDTLLYAVDFPGAYTRGESLEIAKEKMPAEIQSYCAWASLEAPGGEVEIMQDASCNLEVKDADSDVLFESEKAPLTMEEYQRLKALALKSAADFLALYETVPDKNRSNAPERRTFYGPVPRTAEEMYQHTKSVNAYYFGEIDVTADNEGSILDCRCRGFAELEKQPGFLDNPVIEGSYGESWTLRKVLRRFIWHDRIHAKAMYRMTTQIWGAAHIHDVFCWKKIMAITFVLAKTSEAPELSELRRKVWQTTYRGSYPDDMIVNFDYAFHNERNRMFIQSERFIVYFIMDGAKRIGYLILQKNDPLHLQSLYLLDAYRGKGIGTMAFNLVRSYCREHGITKFDLDCHPDNSGSLAFYAKMGGVITHRDEGHRHNEENGLRIEFTI